MKEAFELLIHVLKITLSPLSLLISDKSVLQQNILQNISEIVDEMYIDDIQEELIERNISNEEIFEDLIARFPDNSHQQVMELIVELLKSGMESLLVDVMLLNGMDELVSKLLITEKEQYTERRDDPLCQGRHRF